jgi:hypothetical protein
LSIPENELQKGIAAKREFKEFRRRRQATESRN